MYKLLKSKKLLALSITLLSVSVNANAKEDQVIHLRRGFTVPLQLPENAATVALGNPDLVGINTLKPNFLMINGQDTGTTSLTVIGKSNSIYQYQLVVGNDVYQLRQLVGLVDKGVTVDDVNGVIVLRGKVASTAALTRVLSVADRFVGGNGPSSIKVLSDQGGVLAGNINGNTEFEPPLRSILSQIGTLNVGGGQGGGGQGGGGQGGGGQGGGVNQALQIMDAKGNLAQNLQRASVISLAGGKVISLIKVSKQPKVEMQLRIVAVDRNKTDRLGIDWRLDGNKVTIGSLLGRNVQALPAPNTPGSVNIGNSNLLTLLPNFGDFTLQTFIRALEEKGASKTLSEPLLTAVSGESSSFLVGGSLPIPVQTVVPGNINQNTTVVNNFTYLQFGLQLVVRPTVLENGKVSVVLDQSISEPNFANAVIFNGFQIPTFNTRYVTTITESESGETWAVAGLLTEEDTKSLRSIPWLSKVPMIGFLFQNKEDSITRNELMILVNARVIDGQGETSTTSFEGIGNLYPESNKDKNLPIEDKPSHDPAMHLQQIPLPTLRNIPEPNRSGKRLPKNKGLLNQGVSAQEQRKNVQIINPNINHKTETMENGVKIIQPASGALQEQNPVQPEDSITPNETIVKPSTTKPGVAKPKQQKPTQVQPAQDIPTEVKSNDTQPNIDFESKSKSISPNTNPNGLPSNQPSNIDKKDTPPQAVVQNQPSNEANDSTEPKVKKTVRGKIVYYEDRGTASNQSKSVLSAGMPINPIQVK